MSFWGELKRRNVFKVGVAYLLIAWIIAQVVGVVNEPLGLPPWFDTAVLVLLAIGFPLALIFAWAYELTPAGLKRTEDAPPNVGTSTGRGFGYVLQGLLAGAVVGSGAVWLWGRDADTEWLRGEAIPEIEALIQASDWEAAFALTAEAEQRMPGNPELADLWPRVSRSFRITSDPPGARVFRAPYDAGDEAWLLVGQTPLDAARIPIGLSKIRLELDGYRPVLQLASFIAGDLGGPQSTEYVQALPPFKLDTADVLPEGKIRVAGWVEPIAGTPTQFEDFFLDRYEVTNAQYKAFVDAGGYRRREFWRHPIVEDGRELSWEDAMARFVDRTGRPGPSQWEAGDYPEGQADYPVGGVSWYEAAAYAAFVGEELPTVYHWNRAVNIFYAAWRLPRSNLEGDGPARVGQFDGLSWSGAYDLTGNVREWVYNASGEQRFVTGGAWNDQAWLANIPMLQSPADRLAINGFRLMITSDNADAWRRAQADVPPIVQPESFEPQYLSDEVFDVYRSLYSYDELPLNAQVDAGASIEDRSWIRERITIDTAYGERMPIYLYLPRVGAPPYQTLVLMPGGHAWFLDSFDQTAFMLDFVVKSGRAVAVPILAGSFERRDAIGIAFRNWNTQAARTRLIEIMQDLSRTLDYLETRRDIDADGFAYFGNSNGAVFAPLSLAMEPRWRAGVLVVAGYSYENPPFAPEIDPARFLTRVHKPVLMMNGELDSVFPAETHARPFFEQLGTDEKKFVVAPGGHFVPRETLVRETLDWLDGHVGPAIESY